MTYLGIKDVLNQYTDNDILFWEKLKKTQLNGNIYSDYELEDYISILIVPRSIHVFNTIPTGIL